MKDIYCEELDRELTRIDRRLFQACADGPITSAQLKDVVDPSSERGTVTGLVLYFLAEEKVVTVDPDNDKIALTDFGQSLFAKYFEVPS